MKKHLLFLGLLSTMYFVDAQQKIYAITGQTPDRIEFNDIRKLDLNNEGNKQVLLNSKEQSSVVFSQILQANINESKNTIHNSTSQMLAALAMDTSSDNLLYFPMFSSNLYAFNNRTKKITLVENTIVKSTACDLGSHITRMSNGAKGEVYALDNAGKNLIKISNIKGKYQIENLGEVKDKSNEKSVSFHDVKSGYGGDMISDTEGNLYVISASANVFKIDVSKMMSSFLGKIRNLPQDFTVNGAAVDNDGNVILASGKGGGFYSMNILDLNAKIISTSGKETYVYDLASSELLNFNNDISEKAEDEINIYPTKVKSGTIHIDVKRKGKSNFVFEIYDMRGLNVLSKDLKFDATSKYSINTGNLQKGVYIAVVKDESGKKIKVENVIIE